MKTITTVLIILFSNTLIAQCKDTQMVEYLVYLDVTDQEHLNALSEFMPLEYKAMLDDIETLGAFKKCHGINLEVYPINDLGDNRGVRIGFEPIGGNLTDVQIARQIKPKFAVELRDAIKKIISSHNSSYKYTRIYEPLCNALLKLKKIDQEVTIVVFSDMLEHNSTSFYTKGNAIDRDKTIEKMAKQCQCNFKDDLSNATIKFVSFRTSSNDRNISNATRFWVDFFQAKKAIVQFGSSLL